MTRVHTVARAGRKQRSVSVRVTDHSHNHKKPTFKIVKEYINREKKKFRTVASYNAQPPDGYSFIPVGYPDLTDLCRKKCQDENLLFQTVNATPKNKANLDTGKVSHHIHRVGNHFPTDIVESACKQLSYWMNPDRPGEYQKYNAHLENRLSHHKHKDERDKIRSAIQELFPNLPAKDLKEILHHAFRKGSMRVGNADMPLIRRVQLAVSAHARHNYTEYDQLLKRVSWGEARQLAEEPTLNQLKKWRGEDFDNHETEQVLRETIVIDSESEDESDAESSDDSNDTAARNGDRDVSLEFVAHNTYGNDRAADVARNGTAHHHDAYIAPSRRQAEYQALNSLHRRDEPTNYRLQHSSHPSYERLQPPPPLPPNNDQYYGRTGAQAYVRPEPHQTHAALPNEYRSARLMHDAPPTNTDHGSFYTHAGRRPDTNASYHYAQAHYESPKKTGYDGYAPVKPIPAYYTYSERNAPAPRNGAYEYERNHDPQLPLNTHTHNPTHPRLVREATPDRPLPSVERDSPYRPQRIALDSPPPGLGPRLVTDRNGQTVVVAPPLDQYQRREPGPAPTTAFIEQPPTNYYIQGEMESKRRRISPHAAYDHLSRARPMADTIDDSPTHRSFYYDERAPVHAAGQAPRVIERIDPATGRIMRLVPIADHDTGRSANAPVWLDGPAERPEPKVPVRRDYTYPAAPYDNATIRHGYDRPPLGSTDQGPSRPVPIAQEVRREKRAPPPQLQHPDDAMRSLYDERDPQPQRKAHKKHHANRTRYHDHDSSAVRQQDQSLDYS